MWARSIRHAGFFGLVARGEARSDSDIDIVVELDPGARLSLFDYVGLKNHIAGLFDGSVDVIDREAIKPHLRLSVARDLVHAF